MALQIRQATGATCAVRITRAALQRHGGVMPRWEHRCGPARHVQKVLLLPLSRKKNSPSSLMMRARLHLLAAPASSADTKMQVTLCCTHDGGCALHNSNRILSHHTPQ
ncbi:hypothetical protein TcG_12436 [Trypanosoma cruzi]|nr:hypothetical protein TcG_12436 [Trypanosoma cruzi]